MPHIVCQHIGSTAVPGCFAKPILDVLITYETHVDVHDLERAFTKLGFLWKGDYGIPERSFFTLYDETGTLDFVHLHAFPVGNKNIELLVSFVHVLKNSPELVEENSNMKLNLKKSNVSRADYPAAKSAWIQNALKNVALPA